MVPVDEDNHRFSECTGTRESYSLGNPAHAVHGDITPSPTSTWYVPGWRTGNQGFVPHTLTKNGELVYVELTGKWLDGGRDKGSELPRPLMMRAAANWNGQVGDRNKTPQSDSRCICLPREHGARVLIHSCVTGRMPRRATFCSRAARAWLYACVHWRRLGCGVSIQAQDTRRPDNNLLWDSPVACEFRRRVEAAFTPAPSQKSNHLPM
ncbi:hypothetical protein JVT61DRAFT_8927 [Boletus reticuloceps]|uniref:Uncharacterized protein n=1 Tax=Boletus reticuloceps TaxID=495285 RepID=A0A8I3A552_9AGAM|nr:hypothetical protein JVT61DRAFT_8927 [Boletus reticuloceps]